MFEGENSDKVGSQKSMFASLMNILSKPHIKDIFLVHISLK